MNLCSGICDDMFLFGGAGQSPVLCVPGVFLWGCEYYHIYIRNLRLLDNINFKVEIS